jgi:hypothetical protein
VSIADRIASNDRLPQMVQADNFVGWIYQIDYENALVMTNDIWKSRVNGVPHNAFLLAATFDPDSFTSATNAQKEVVLLRVVGSSKLPMDDHLVSTKIEHFQERESNRPGENELDDLTRNQLQFSGLQCRVLGTFYTNQDGRLCLGSDLESYHSAAQLHVYKPRGDVLSTIVNYISPIREAAAQEDAERLGIEGSMPSFEIGAVRYTSSNRLQQSDSEVIFSVQSIDFLARRTAVFGMTRTGKSNMIKQLVSVVKRTASQTGLQIGQIIYDLNGEYANANQQDVGALADVYPKETERYRMLPAKGFHLIQNNFYLQIEEGFRIIQELLGGHSSPSADLKSFLSVSFERPSEDDRSALTRYQLKTAIYQAVLYKAGFEYPSNFRVSFSANKKVRERVDPINEFPQADQLGRLTMTLPQAVKWLDQARSANREKVGAKPNPLLSSSGEDWIDGDAKALLNMLVQKNDNDSFITGFKHINPLKAFHSPDRTQDVSEEIYQHLIAGKIVILDLSVGDPNQRTRLSKVIAQHIFKRSMGTFNEGGFPPSIMIYVEEAHNIMGRGDDLTDAWPRIAKEGAKFRIGIVYATQEVSSMHPNILSNTENMFVSHINNESEVRELAKFYDFKDFGTSLIRAQDVGFARVKTLSSPFVIPVQIHKFDPERERARNTETAN